MYSDIKKKLPIIISTSLLLSIFVPGMNSGYRSNIFESFVFAETPEYDVTEPHVIINQVYGAGKDGYVSHSFIELYNPTQISVDMEGWSVQYKSSEDGSDIEWQKLELTSSINAHSSYLIRCGAVSDSTNVKYGIESFDQEWDQSIHNKGFSVVLLSDSNDISNASDVFDNVTEKPVIVNYVDMLSAAGNDYVETDKKKRQKPYHYEKNFSAIQSKKKSVRRINFKDTDDNATDTEAVDYSADISLISDYCPRSGKDGEWTSADIEFSVDSGFYESPFDLEMYTPGDGDIYYTLDGSIPNPLSNNTISYNAAIPIDDATDHPNVWPFVVYSG